MLSRDFKLREVNLLLVVQKKCDILLAFGGETALLRT